MISGYVHVFFSRPFDESRNLGKKFLKTKHWQQIIQIHGKPMSLFHLPPSPAHLQAISLSALPLALRELPYIAFQEQHRFLSHASTWMTYPKMSRTSHLSAERFPQKPPVGDPFSRLKIQVSTMYIPDIKVMEPFPWPNITPQKKKKCPRYSSRGRPQKGIPYALEEFSMNCPTAVEYHIDLDLGCRWVFFQAKVGWHGTTWLPFSAGNTQFFATNKMQEVE